MTPRTRWLERKSLNTTKLNTTKRFLVATGVWWFLLAGPTLLATLVLSPAVAGQDTLLGALEYLLGASAQTLPFAAFAGGLACPRGERDGWPRMASALALGVAVVAYGLGEFALPWVEYEVDRAAGASISTVYPHGPETPSNLRAVREAVISASPPEYSFGIQQPLAHPPNWLTHRIHQPIAFALLAIPNAILGALVASLTHGLPPPRRRRRRWTAGLALALTVLAAVVAADGWIVADADRSGLVSGWAPLLVPLAWLIVLVRRLRRGQNSFELGDPDV